MTKSNDPLFEERPRIKRLRKALINEIPRFPNDRASLEHMQKKHLADLLIDYASWRSRYVGARPRKVEIESTASGDPRWSHLSKEIESFLDKVRRGDDLSPHLSIKPRTQGYAPAARARRVADKWLDKDFVLNTKGYHHFHLGTSIEKKGHAARTNDVLLAEVSRERFTIIAIFSHEVFEQGSAERQRLAEVHDQIAFRGMPPGSVVISGAIATSGHTIQCVMYAQKCARWIADLEPKLDSVEFARSLYRNREEAPSKPKPEWWFNHLDLAIHDKAKPALLLLQPGWN